jgi:hypothetical protein
LRPASFSCPSDAFEHHLLFSQLAKPAIKYKRAERYYGGDDACSRKAFRNWHSPDRDQKSNGQTDE